MVKNPEDMENPSKKAELANKRAEELHKIEEERRNKGKKEKEEFKKGYVEYYSPKEKGEDFRKSYIEHYYPGAKEVEEDFKEGYKEHYFPEEEEKKPEKKEGQETLDETTEELAPEKLTTEKVNELMAQGKLKGENLSEISQLQDRVKKGEISKEDFAGRIQEMFERNKEEQEKLLAERELERTIDESERTELKENFIGEVDDYLKKLVDKEEETKDYNEAIKNLEGKWFKGKKIKELEKSQDKAEKEKKEINENIEEKIDEYVVKYKFSASELRELIKERKKQIKEEKGESLEEEEESTEKEKREAEKRAEGVEEAIDKIDEETEENIAELTKEKKSILEKLKSPKGRLLLTALIAGATVACPLTSGFGIYGLLHTGLTPMGANLIAGYIGGSEVVRNIRELIKARKQAKAEKE